MPSPPGAGAGGALSGGPAVPGRKADAVSLITAVEVPRRPAALLEPIIGGSRFLQLDGAADQVRRLLAGRAIWNVNSTAAARSRSSIVWRDGPARPPPADAGPGLIRPV